MRFFNKDGNLKEIGIELEDVEKVDTISEIEGEDKKEMNLIDALLSSDISNFKRKETKVKLPSLTKILGEDAILTVKEIQPLIVEELNKRYIRITEDGIETDTRKLNNHMVIEMSFVEDEQIFKNKKLMKHFKCTTPPELVEKVLSAGEISQLNKLYTKLNGFKDDIEELKN